MHVIASAALRAATTSCNYGQTLMRFEWDEAKRRSNALKHGIDFADCEAVFEGRTYTEDDDRFGYGEQRFITFGFLDEMVVKIAHTESSDVIRLISARKATRDEQTFFYKTLGLPH